MPKYYTVAQVAEILKIRKNYIYDLIYKGQLEAVRLSEKRFRISDDALKEYLEKQKIITT